MDISPKFIVFKWSADQKVITVKSSCNLCPRCCNMIIYNAMGKKNKIELKIYQKEESYSHVALRKMSRG